MSKDFDPIRLLEQDHDWEKLLKLFSSIEDQLQDLYWQVIECIDKPERGSYDA
jgi:hypothetical protein